MTLPFRSCAAMVLTMTGLAHADLAEYVARPDTSYGFTRLGEGKLPDGALYTEIVLTSQTWRDITWKHRLTIVRPAELVKPSHALLIISGGEWRDGTEKARFDNKNRDLQNAGALAAMTRLPVAVLNQVPFQPIFGGKYEDAIISHTFEQFMKTGEADWPLLMPMVKAAVRAMDTVQTVARDDWKMEIPNFVVTGASKRGWTTYLTSTVDKRVSALAPMVFDTLSMNAQMKYQVESYGKYSEQIADYTDKKLQDHLDTPPGRKLVALVDPYEYIEKLTQPKLIILGTNDRYWTLDALNLYWPALKGEKYVLYVPNSGHGLNDFRRVSSDIAALVLRAAGKLEFPKPSWEFAESGDSLKLTLRCNVKPTQVLGWTTTAKTRDFRDSKWTSQELETQGDAYTLTLPRPQKGMAAGFGELHFDIDGHPLFLSTTIRIVEAAP